MRPFLLRILLLILVIPHAIAGQKYDSGVKPSVVTIGDIVIEAHESEHFSTLWYKTGTIDNKKIIWSKSIKFAKGTHPALANVGNTLVSVYQHSNHLTYQIGTLDSETQDIRWGRAMPLGFDGILPKITASENKFIVQNMVPYLDYVEAVFDDKGNFLYFRYHYYYTLHYALGTLEESSKTIEWIDLGELPHSTLSSSITSAGNTLVELNHHKNGYLWYRVGTINDNMITWGNIYNYESSARHPSISMKGHTIIETHQCKTFHKTLCYAVGFVDEIEKRIKWSTLSHRYDRGVWPSVKLTDNRVIEVHESEGFSTLYSNVGLLSPEKKSIDWN